MTHAKLPAGIELLIGLDIDHSTHTATISILQPRAIKGAAIIYANRHPLKGDHMGRAFTVAQLEDAAATYSIATDPRYSELATALANVKTTAEFAAAFELLSAHVDCIMQRHQRNIAQLMNVNTHLAESLASAPMPKAGTMPPAALDNHIEQYAGAVWNEPNSASQVDPRSALPSIPVARIERAASPATASGDELTTAECPTCNGHGLIGGHSGQTPESYEEHAKGCDDCGGQGRVIVSRADLAAVSAATKPTADLSKLDLFSPIEGSKMEMDNACGQYVRFADVQSLLATKPAAAPTDYVLVPRELTPEMAIAVWGRDGIQQAPGSTYVDEEVQRLYRAMLAAAPTAAPADHATTNKKG